MDTFLTLMVITSTSLLAYTVWVYERRVSFLLDELDLAVELAAIDAAMERHPSARHLRAVR